MAHRVWHSVWTRNNDWDSWRRAGWYWGEKGNNVLSNVPGCHRMRAVVYGREGQIKEGATLCQGGAYNDLRPGQVSYALYEPAWYPIFDSSFQLKQKRFDGWLWTDAQGAREVGGYPVQVGY